MTRVQAQNKAEPVRVQRRGSSATERILTQSLELCERVGLDALTMEGIALHSGMAKTTMYRRWPNVSALMMDAVLFEVSKAAPIHELSTVRETFAVSMKLLVKFYESRYGTMLRMLIGRAQVNPELRESLTARWVEPRRARAREILQRGIGSGEIRPELDPDLVLDLLYGPIYHRLLVPYQGAGMTDRFVEDVLEAVFAGIAAPSCRTVRFVSVKGERTC